MAAEDSSHVRDQVSETTELEGTTLGDLPDLVGWYAIYSGSNRMDLGPKRPVAIMHYKSHAERLIKDLWPGYGYWEIIQ